MPTFLKRLPTPLANLITKNQTLPFHVKPDYRGHIKSIQKDAKLRNIKIDNTYDWTESDRQRQALKTYGAL